LSDSVNLGDSVNKSVGRLFFIVLSEEEDEDFEDKEDHRPVGRR